MQLHYPIYAVISSVVISPRRECTAAYNRLQHKHSATARLLRQSDMQ